MPSLRKRWSRFRRKHFGRVRLTGKHYVAAKEILLDVTDRCEAAGIDYALDCGTLLGIAREGDLIPWDFDLDITVPVADVEKFRSIMPGLAERWRLYDDHLMESAQPGWKVGDLRSIKVRNYRFPMFKMGRGRIVMDVFVTYPNDDQVEWVMLNHVCRAPKEHFEGRDTLQFAGRDLRAPRNHEGYLELVYGPNWRIPDPDFKWDDHGSFDRHATN
ncbi:MAG: LicD family protein [Pseudomonadota bacterium]